MPSTPSVAVAALSLLGLSSATPLKPRQAPSTYQLAATNNYLPLTSVKTTNASLNTGAAARFKKYGHQLLRDLGVEEEWAAKVNFGGEEVFMILEYVEVGLKAGKMTILTGVAAPEVRTLGLHRKASNASTSRARTSQRQIAALVLSTTARSQMARLQAKILTSLTVRCDGLLQTQSGLRVIKVHPLTPSLQATANSSPAIWATPT